MKVQQISVFLENRRGRLAAVTGCLGNQGINIRAFSIADTSDFGILRLIVTDPQSAYRTLKAEGFTVSVTDVIAVEVPDEPGGMARVLELVHQAEVDIEYLYAFVRKRSDNALVILRLEDFERAEHIFAQNGVRVVPSDEVYAM